MAIPPPPPSTGDRYVRGHPSLYKTRRGTTLPPTNTQWETSFFAPVSPLVVRLRYRIPYLLLRCRAVRCLVGAGGSPGCGCSHWVWSVLRLLAVGAVAHGRCPPSVLNTRCPVSGAVAAVYPVHCLCRWHLRWVCC
eukprot:m.47293 g.47293  ORF g.47293 m.47293 type:complete len:136 (-) comp15212_c0_seq1:355-762(-)